MSHKKRGGAKAPGNMKGLRSKVLNDVFASPKKKKYLMAGHVNYVCAVVESIDPCIWPKAPLERQLNSLLLPKHIQ